MMNIVVLSGSPRKNGNTQLLVEAFAEGAAQAGHQLTHFDTAAMNIGPCLACYHCRREKTAGVCARKDDMEQIYAALVQAQVLVLATPLYYFGFSAQLKAAIDRFFSIEGLKRTGDSKGGVTRMALLAVCGDDEEAMSGLTENYRHIYSYLGIENMGEVLAAGVYEKGDIAGHAALEQARKLGEAL